MDLGLFGWIFVGFVAGSISGWFVKDRTVSGCLPTILVGVVGGILGGWLSRELGLGEVEGLLGAILFATVGSVLVRLILQAVRR